MICDFGVSSTHLEISSFYGLGEQQPILLELIPLSQFVLTLASATKTDHSKDRATTRVPLLATFFHSDL